MNESGRKPNTTLRDARAARAARERYRDSEIGRLAASLHARAKALEREMARPTSAPALPAPAEG